MKKTLINLAELHYEFGLIDYDELNERYGVALWLADELPQDVVDPRSYDDESCEETEDDREDHESGVISTTSKNNEQDWLEFLFNGLWVFTKEN